MTNSESKKNPKGAGRKKGVPNKINASVKAAVYEAFTKAGGADYLYDVAMSDPKTFCALLSKVMPTEISGLEGEAIKVATTINIVGK